MAARLLVLVVAVLGLIAVTAGSPVTDARSAMRQGTNSQLEATVEALETQVAEQEERIAKLEEDVEHLTTTVFMLLVDPKENARASSGNASGASGETHLIEGTIDLQPRFGKEGTLEDNFLHMGPNTRCSGTNGFEDLKGEMEVVISDGSGDVLATGRTTPGSYQQFDNVCRFVFSVRVPTSDFYALRIGLREGPTYSFAEMEAMSWALVLTIG